MSLTKNIRINLKDALTSLNGNVISAGINQVVGQFTQSATVATGPGLTEMQVTFSAPGPITQILDVFSSAAPGIFTYDTWSITLHYGTSLENRVGSVRIKVDTISLVVANNYKFESESSEALPVGPISMTLQIEYNKTTTVITGVGSADTVVDMADLLSDGTATLGSFPWFKRLKAWAPLTNWVDVTHLNYGALLGTKMGIKTSASFTPTGSPASGSWHALILKGPNFPFSSVFPISAASMTPIAVGDYELIGPSGPVPVVSDLAWFFALPNSSAWPDQDVDVTGQSLRACFTTIDDFRDGPSNYLNY